MLSDVRARGNLRAVTGRVFPLLLVAFAMLVGVTTKVVAAEYAALVMDARNGKVLHSRNADTRLHPASLTKMMTLYIAFEAVEHGEIGLDTLVTVSRNAAAEPPSKLGLRAGQKIKLRYLIRAAAVKSANDAATAIGEAIEGSEAAFARRMNRTAKALGMSRTTFKNAHGLTESGHLSTARDMSVLGRHLFYDYPEYYNIFSRVSTDAGGTTVYHTNRRFLASYEGADGIKTGYTSAAGFNLTASAKRGNERIITTVFGGRSTASRNARVAELMDLGFKRAPSSAAVIKPKKPPYLGHGSSGDEIIVAGDQTAPRVASKIIRVDMTITKSPFPTPRPKRGFDPEEETMLLAMSDDILNAVTAAEEEAAVLASAEAATAEASEIMDEAIETAAEVSAETPPSITPKPRPRVQLASIEPTSAIATALPTEVVETAPEVVTRISTSGSRHWGVNIGTYGTEYEARKILLKTALSETAMLDGALRKVVKSNRGYQANFLGLTEDLASMTCRRLSARGVDCDPIGPS
ncbi:serine hydrolase [Celeribacter sp.]|uniref:serine hydrolase n=1 Tax=Celeribacter sp. TaxID=1890673 RepID=UPI003A946D01